METINEQNEYAELKRERAQDTNLHHQIRKTGVLAAGLVAGVGLLFYWLEFVTYC